MICPGCLNDKNIKKGEYCNVCRKVLFGGKNIPTTLNFDKQDYIDFRVNSGGRFSISGVQPKILLRLDRKELIPVTENGEYILKPAPLSYNIPRFPQDVPANEHLTMQIAKQIFKMKVAANALINLKSGESAYLTLRFDRKRSGEKIPQEDFAQLLKMTSETHGDDYKYETSYESAAMVIEKFCSAKAVEIEKYYKMVLFCYVFSNGDAHLKNFSLQKSPQGDHILTPAYDLLSTSVHFPNETRTALDLFKSFETQSFKDNAFYSGACFLEFADHLKVRKSFAEKTIDSFFDNKEKVVEFVKRSFLSEDAGSDYIYRFHDRLRALEIK